MSFKSLRDAAQYAGVSHVAVRLWCDQYQIGNQTPDGRWCIDRDRLDRVLAARRQITDLREAMRA